ncbi:MAG: laccase domain protein [Alphaproteobacteria bacterium]|nr:MAG: laccase domain protein [Alphaproteobacteria bacterium]
MTRPAPIQCGRLDALSPAFIHGFFTRHGGVSRGLFAGLNVGLGSGDRPADVAENRRRVAAWLDSPTPFLATPHQTHSPTVETVTAAWPPDARPRADAVVTDRPGVPLGVLTADCGPILFADASAGVIAAAHAGWRGALDGVIENTVAAMERLGARRAGIRATLGPTISQDSYEVGPEFVDRLLAAGAGNRRFLRASPRPDHAQFDLPGYILFRLEAAGVEAEWTGQCTYADEARFFSFRRTTHRGEPDYGRQISAIMMRS